MSHSEPADVCLQSHETQRSATDHNLVDAEPCASHRKLGQLVALQQLQQQDQHAARDIVARHLFPAESARTVHTNTAAVLFRGLGSEQ
jgi:hypothetical protein